jgi:hypothetical protein
MTTIAIAGISGKLGSMIARQILQYPGTTLRGLCRSKARVPPEILSNPRVSIVEGEVDDFETAKHAVHGSMVTICCYLGGPDVMIKGQQVLIDASIAEKVPRYIASDYSLDYRKLKPTDIPSKYPCFAIKSYLEDKPIKGVHILIGCFLEAYLYFLQIYNPKENTMTYYGTGSEKWDMTTYRNAAEYIAAVALDDKAEGFLKCKSISAPFDNQAHHQASLCEQVTVNIRRI